MKQNDENSENLNSDIQSGVSDDHNSLFDNLEKEFNKNRREQNHNKKIFGSTGEIKSKEARGASSSKPR